MPASFYTVDTPQKLGRMLRAVRKQQGLRQDQVGRFSHTFIGEVEKGKPTAQIGKVLALLQELGIGVRLEMPADIKIDL